MRLNPASNQRKAVRSSREDEESFCKGLQERRLNQDVNQEGDQESNQEGNQEGDDKRDKKAKKRDRKHNGWLAGSDDGCDWAQGLLLI